MYSFLTKASARAWRLIQDKPCKTFYPFYTDLMENQAVELVGAKRKPRTYCMAIPAAVA